MRFKNLFCIFWVFIPVFLSAQTENKLDMVNLKLSKEKARILSEYKGVPNSFVLAFDSAVEYGLSKPISSRTERYQERLLNYVERIYSSEYLLSGRYTAGLSFHKLLVDATESNTLSELINSYPAFSLHHMSLFSDDEAAFFLLKKLAEENPNVVLLNAIQYYDKSYAQNIIDVIISTAPDITKQFFVGDNVTTKYILNSKTEEAVVLKKIFNEYGLASKAYLLTNEILHDRLNVKQSDSMSKNPNHLFSLLTKTLTYPEPAGKYSVNHQLAYQSVMDVRNIVNMGKSSAQPSAYTSFIDKNINELFVILLYGYQDARGLIFENIWNIFKKQDGKMVNQNLLSNCDHDALISFIQFLDDRSLLQEFLRYVPLESKNKLLSVVSEQMPTEISPNLNVWNLRSKPEPVVKAVEVIENTNTTPKPVEDVPEEITEPIHFSIPAEQTDLLRWKKNINYSLQQIPEFINEPYAKEILLLAAAYEPDEVLKKYDNFLSKYFSIEVIEKAALNAPCSFNKYLFNSEHPITVAAHRSTNPLIKKMIEMHDSTSVYSKPFVLFDDIAKGKLSISSAIKLTENQLRYFRELIKIISQPSYYGKYNIEKELIFYSLKFIRAINDNIKQSESVRFASIEGLSTDELYTLMVFGREEVFTSTFAGIFSRFEQQLPPVFSTPVFNQFLTQPKYKSFIALCANYNKLNEFLQHFSTQQRKQLLEVFASELNNQNSDMTDAVLVAEVIMNSSNQELLEILQEKIKSEYLSAEQQNNFEKIAVYGMLVNILKDKAVGNDIDWFKKIGKKFQSISVTALRDDQLKEGGKIIERMYFYDDGDGRESFSNFTSTFKNTADWHVEDNFNYVRVYASGKNNIEIFANKPDFVDGGEQSIKKVFTERNLQPTVIIHRGHSFHTENTLCKVPSQAKLIFVGSCGGFYKISIALKNAPDAQVIATKQIGTQSINDPMILSINEYLRKGKSIQWKSFWEEMRVKLGSNSYFQDYVPPHKNMESIFIRAYFQLLGVA